MSAPSMEDAIRNAKLSIDVAAGGCNCYHPCGCYETAIDATLRTLVDRAQREALEEAAGKCDLRAAMWNANAGLSFASGNEAHYACHLQRRESLACANSIRALLPAAPQEREG